MKRLVLVVLMVCALTCGCDRYKVEKVEMEKPTMELIAKDMLVEFKDMLLKGEIDGMEFSYLDPSTLTMKSVEINSGNYDMALEIFNQKLYKVYRGDKLVKVVRE